MEVVALAGGIGAARFLRGLIRVVEPSSLTVIANTGDDLELHGLHVSPDLDTITYTLGGGVHPEQGWGRADESAVVAGELEDRYGVAPWFTLGDRDLATHLVRTEALRNGERLSAATARIAAAWSLPFTLLPMTDDPVATIVTTADGRQLHFQRWWVGERAKPPVASVRLNGAQTAKPAPGVLEALIDADVVVLCPSNPVVSIGTILSVRGIRDALQHKPVVGVSPIISGRVVRGMADKLLPAEGVEVSCVGVARYYQDFLNGWVIDDQDGDREAEVRSLGMAVAVTQSVMATPEIAADLARTTLSLVT
jgi:LPPG:FO 2-phospho-L-lactate transferase